MSSLNHIFKFGTTALAALVLSACGSSGGGSDDQDVSAPSNQTEQSQPSTAANNTQQPTTSSSQPTSPTTTPNQVLTAKNIGFVIPKVKGAEVEIAYPKAEAVDLDVLNVEGKSFNIVPTGWAASEVLEITSNNVTRLVSGTKYKNVRWGLISQEGLNNHYLLAYGINPTTNMPATGQATYVGNGVHSYASNGEGIDTYHLSNAKFNVNFADKSLEGSITPANNKPFGSVNEVKLSAKIDGNQFSGKTAEGTETGGRFYGFGASELSGSYINPQATQIGVFGAQKQ
ncbi:transferrin-binding protein-like solute binding protein [Haemophilus parainfluenzae]|jgi:raw score 6.86|uniref:transferrin-binding protein-like solute binding protein n=2 Tax=Haemophilus TaxID=724 RepID=UPI00223EA80B|nr:transferrin-binding protein-like solute binding protein [Haemophilus parainfluenzae]